MTLDELIQQLTELKDSGKEIGKYKVVFYRRIKSDLEIDRVKVYSGSMSGMPNKIELINID